MQSFYFICDWSSSSDEEMSESESDELPSASLFPDLVDVFSTSYNIIQERVHLINALSMSSVNPWAAELFVSIFHSFAARIANAIPASNKGKTILFMINMHVQNELQDMLQISVAFYSVQNLLENGLSSTRVKMKYNASLSSIENSWWINVFLLALIPLR